jgi:hypothetical protein
MFFYGLKLVTGIRKKMTLWPFPAKFCHFFCSIKNAQRLNTVMFSAGARNHKKGFALFASIGNSESERLNSLGIINSWMSC